MKALQPVPHLVAAVLLAAPALAGASSWELDPAHTAAQFSVKHMMISTVRGQFGKTTGSVELDDKDIAKSSVQATIDVSTIDTRSPERDAHLKSPDFFDVARFPSMTFKSKRVEKGAPNHLRVVGDLTIRDVTREVALDVELGGGQRKDPWGNLRQGATATTRIVRKDFGLVWNKALEGGGVLVGDDVNITLDIEMTRKAPVKS